MSTNLFDPEKFDAKRLYVVYKITIRVREALFGGTPKNPELIEKWILARTKNPLKKEDKERIPDSLTKAQIKEAVANMTEEEATDNWTGFQQDERGIFLHCRNVKRMMVECSSVQGIIKAKRGSKQIFQHGFEVKGMYHDTHCHFDNRTTEDGFEEGAIHVMTAKGPRTSIKRQDYVGDGAELSYWLWVLKMHPNEARYIGPKDLTNILCHAQEDGLGASRSQSKGKFDIIAFEKMDDGEIDTKKAPGHSETKKSGRKGPA